MVRVERITDATAYVRAMSIDPMGLSGDFVAILHRVNLQAANILMVEVGDGTGTPFLEPEALGFLRAKMQGKFIVSCRMAT